MRALHLGFQLYQAYSLNSADNWRKGYFGGEIEFKEADKRNFQPLFALLERNVQRYNKLHVSLAVSGAWLEQAEHWDADLISRLKKLVQTEQVELVVLPYNYAMAAFYDLDELTTQVQRTQEKFEQLLGEKAQSVALPGLCYHNRLAHWAEKLGFRTMWAGAATKSLAWRSVNNLYDVKGSQHLRVVFVNERLSKMVSEASKLTTVQIETEIKIDQPDVDIATELKSQTMTATDFVRGIQETQTAPELTTVKVEKKTVFSAKKFQKQLELEFLRGDLVNLYFEAEILGKWRDLGVIGFFDELFKLWLEAPGGKLVGVQELEKLAPVAEISVKKTASIWGEAEQDYGLPKNWTEERVQIAQRLYGLRPKVLASGEAELYRDFARLTDLNYADGGDNFEAIVEDLERKLAQRVMTAEDGKTQVARGAVAETTAVKIKFDHSAKEMRERNEALYRHLKEVSGVIDDESEPLWEAEDDVEAAIQVMAQRMKRSSEQQERDTTTLAEAELVDESSEFIEMDDVLADLEVDDELEDEEPQEETPKKNKKTFKKIVID